MIYLADKRQELHFTQVFRCARKTKLVDGDTGLTFIGFGTMNGKDGKPFKTRDGGVMRLENLISDINEEMFRKIVENRSVKDKEAEGTAKIVGLSALKYGDLSTRRPRITFLISTASLLLKEIRDRIFSTPSFVLNLFSHGMRRKAAHWRKE